MCEAFSAWVASAAGTDVRSAGPMGNLPVEKQGDQLVYSFLGKKEGDKVRQFHPNSDPIKANQ